eukprot:PhF_6_TR595/c0_g1_i1/m.682
MRSWLGGGGSGATQPESPVTTPNVVTIPTLLQRIHSATNPSDVRDALTKLAEVPDIATKLNPDASTLLLTAARASPPDPITQRKVMEVLIQLIDDNVEEETKKRYSQHMLAPHTQCIATMLTALRDGDFWGRYSTVQCLTKLCVIDKHKVQQLLLESPNGVGYIGDVLQDTTNDSVLRMEGLILLHTLTNRDNLDTTSPTPVQEEVNKILAFQGCFDRMFEIIRDEGNAASGGYTMPVCDALKCMHAMLSHSPSIQKYYLEMNSLAFLAPLLLFLPENASPTNHAVNNVLTEVLNVVVCIAVGQMQNQKDYERVRSALLKNNIVNAIITLCVHPQVSAEVHIASLKALTHLCNGSPTCAESVVAARCDDASSVFCALIAFALQDVTSPTRQHYAAAFIVVILKTIPALRMDIATSISAKRSPKVRFPSAHLLPFTLLSPKPTAIGVMHSCLLLSCVLSHPEAKDTVAMLPWDDSTLITKLTRQIIGSIAKPGNYNPATLSALLRVLIVWFAQYPKGVSIFLHDPLYLLSLYEGYAREGMDKGIRFLCAAVAVTVCAYCPPELPRTARLTRESLLESFSSRIGLHSMAELISQFSKTVEWHQAPVFVLDVEPSAVFDVELITYIKNAHDTLCDIVVGEFSHMAHGDTKSSGSLPPSKLQQYLDILAYQDGEIRRLHEEQEAIAQPLQSYEADKSANEKLVGEINEIKSKIVAEEEELQLWQDAEKVLIDDETQMTAELTEEIGAIQEAISLKTEELVEMGNAIHSLKQLNEEKEVGLKVLTEATATLSLNSNSPSADRETLSSAVSGPQYTQAEFAALEAELFRVQQEVSVLRREKEKAQKDVEDMLALIGELEEQLSAK